jgi:hypothetical protein
VEQDAGIEDQ